MYKVIERFEDAQDNGHEYQVGDVYPRDGLEVSEERFTELSTTNNRRNLIAIKLVEDKQVEQSEASADEQKSLSDMKVAELKELAKKREIKGYSDMKKDELIKTLEGVK
ncbi:TPA: Rho termination factor N-terminal domain-containing protein [Staphylococcus aureus]|uniref:Rho termination factor N-terminal domain-containing protein n=1 Tax=Staphylococcus aureus TaxID=1280 RepID=UPI00144335D9|nr:Rho termination factor N-terminal domain-containing protein [Staphylococcus aureus]MDD9479998.1 Rho termination factor N-terminal domain-containing protein [Staphylococcus aureus]MDD9496191.1 Rho termination factor N-terminal domain-containing protein [Staphylococcus aureus]NKO83178.1 Rho termination protein [Staphylococcus aureus]HEG7369192.1 Rho termination factor N-terminal domain-containing protein [Staphylococcus aureus]HEH8429820.1 Rho termination factor N-terminal domain-containing p